MGKSCYLCGENEAEIIHYGVRGHSDINVLKCRRCGLVYLSQSLQNVDQFYRNSGMRKQEKLDLKGIRVKAYTDDYRRFQITRNRIENKVVCDFGCGAGGYLLEAEKVASKVYGVELESAMCDAINRESGGGEMFPVYN